MVSLLESVYSISFSGIARKRYNANGAETSRNYSIFIQEDK